MFAPDFKLIAETPGAGFKKVVALEELLDLVALEVEADQMAVEPDLNKVNDIIACEVFWSPVWEVQAPWLGEGAEQRHCHPWDRIA